MNSRPGSAGDALAQTFGFPVPEMMVGLIERVMERFSRGDDAAISPSLGSDALGLIFSPYCSTAIDQWKSRHSGGRNDLSNHDLSNHDLSNHDPTQDTGRYSSTPFELFPMLFSGCDGIHWGPVVHAPELQRPDYPWAEHNPAACEDMRFCGLGADTAEAIAQLLSDHLGCLAPSDNDDDLNQARSIHEISQSLALKPSGAKARDLSAWACRPVIPFIPSGWRFVATSDGAGVLAPSEAFCPELPAAWESHSVDECLERVGQSLRRGYPATALGIIREFYWWDCSYSLESLAQPWIEIYQHLNRPLLAREVERGLQAERAMEQLRLVNSDHETFSVQLTPFAEPDEERMDSLEAAD